MAELLGNFEQTVMLAILRVQDPSYGRKILNQVQESLHRDVSAGSVYATLDRLETRGLLKSWLGDGTPVRGGRPRRYYSVTAEGVRALNEAHDAMAGMWKVFTWPLQVKR